MKNSVECTGGRGEAGYNVVLELKLTVTGHGNSQVHIELQFSRELRVGGEPELVARVEEVVELHVEQETDQ